MSAVEWACPKCGATPDSHGNGGVDKCRDNPTGCGGFVCECDYEDFIDLSHGLSHADPCHLAHCYHCGWGGTFPQKPKGLQAWEKKALEAGWTPPDKRLAEPDQSEGEK